MDKDKPNTMSHKGIWITKTKVNSRVIQLLLQPHLRVFFFLVLSHWVLSTLFNRKLNTDGLTLLREPIRVHLSNAQLLNQSSENQTERQYFNFLFSGHYFYVTLSWLATDFLCSKTLCFSLILFLFLCMCILPSFKLIFQRQLAPFTRPHSHNLS